MSHPRLEQEFIIGVNHTVAGQVPKVSSSLSWADRWGSIKARWNVDRMNFKIDPGIYSLGNPDKESPVLVTANYKMSFDNLRQAIPDLNVWILVLDTDGVNVWCAAGKGTFGTEELERRIEFTGLAQIVSHRELILPQLSAPGVSAHKVKKITGFKVVYGPIRAKDIRDFLDSDRKATPEMRRKGFTLRERFVLIPVEVVSALKWAIIVSASFLILSSLLGPSSFLINILDHGMLAMLAVIFGLIAGTFLTPILLPLLPGRAFSIKGLVSGVVCFMILVLLKKIYSGIWEFGLESFSLLLIIISISSYLAMNFTGCSTYTSLSGVRKEMKTAVPMEICTGAVGVLLWISYLLLL